MFQSYHYYTLNTDGFGAEFIESDSTCLNAAYVFTLPCKEFDGIWENLHFDSEIKNNVSEFNCFDNFRQGIESAVVSNDYVLCGEIKVC